MNVKMLTPALNPLRFTGTTDIDYSEGKMPQFDLMKLGLEYQRGIEVVEFYHDWLFNREISIQIQVEVIANLSDIYLVNIDTNVNTPVTRTNITPVGWVGYYVFRLSVIPPEEGYYYLWAEYWYGGVMERIQSDVLIVRNSDMDIVEIDYKNSFNKFGFVFDDYYKTCFTGQILRESSNNEITIFTDPSAEVYKQDARPQPSATLYLNEIPRIYLPIIGNIFSVNDIKINGIGFETPEAVSFEGDKSDVGIVTIKLIEKENNYMMKI